jgi:hypothetical protein
MSRRGIRPGVGRREESVALGSHDLSHPIRPEPRKRRAGIDSARTREGTARRLSEALTRPIRRCRRSRRPQGGQAQSALGEPQRPLRDRPLPRGDPQSPLVHPQHALGDPQHPLGDLLQPTGDLQHPTGDSQNPPGDLQSGRGALRLAVQHVSAAACLTSSRRRRGEPSPAAGACAAPSP